MSKNKRKPARNKTARAKPNCAPVIGSALAVRIASELMTNHAGEQASRLQMRGPNEEDFGGYCREVVVRIIDKELDFAALARRKPALFRKIRRILKAPKPT